MEVQDVVLVNRTLREEMDVIPLQELPLEDLAVDELETVLPVQEVNLIEDRKSVV